MVMLRLVVLVFVLMMETVAVMVVMMMKTVITTTTMELGTQAIMMVTYGKVSYFMKQQNNWKGFKHVAKGLRVRHAVANTVGRVCVLDDDDVAV